MRGRFFGETEKDSPAPQTTFAKTSTRFKPGGGDIRTFRIMDMPKAFVYSYHYNRGYRICTSSRDFAGLPHFKEHTGAAKPCVYCHYSEKKGDAPRRRVLEVIDFTYYHLVPNGTDWPDEVECGSQGPRPRSNRCKYCQHNDPSIADRHFGGHRIWELSKTQFDQLWSVNDSLARTCLHVPEEGGEYCGGEVTTNHFECPSCGSVEIDDRTAPMMNNAQLVQARRARHICSSCGKGVILNEVTICENSVEGSRHDAFPASVFDKKLELTASAIAKKLRGGKTVNTVSYNFSTSAPYTTLEDDLRAHNFSEEIIEKMTAPWDMIKRYRPERVDLPEDMSSSSELRSYVKLVLDKQAEHLGRHNPFSSDNGQQDIGHGPFSGGRFR